MGKIKGGDAWEKLKETFVFKKVKPNQEHVTLNDICIRSNRSTSAIASHMLHINYLLYLYQK